ncbi:vacuolating cytotoxin domain-containing protein [Helicobacter cetorum]|uniref:Toxin-like outer membrane protein n=1 Tax=Helicobacter cetorum (strain ATCC BAA-429 / MIT 00-7128) TaxID=182217 RepID=I0EKJ4_HELC0|nr:vacuolating cytotoxin domain-containing protein [Helicobacter cetorum]AFI03463.1 toxin-like outer membrane protein [Helicobacter cetorum MIT 00-7128]
MKALKNLNNISKMFYKRTLISALAFLGIFENQLVGQSYNLGKNSNIVSWMNANNYYGNNSIGNLYNNGSYYCFGWYCGTSWTLIGDKGIHYTLNNFIYAGGNLTLNLAQSSISLSNDDFYSYYGSQVNNAINAQAINLSNSLQVGLNAGGNYSGGPGNTTLNLNSSNINANNANIQVANNSSLTFNGNTTLTNSQLKSDNTSQIDFKDQATFNNTTFNSGVYNFSSGNLTFNGDTFNQGVSFNFGSNDVIFSHTNTLTSSTPFTDLKGNVSFSPNAVFNINQTLSKNQTYDILHTSGTINYGNNSNSLWDLIDYQGQKAISDKEVKNDVYDVVYDIDNQDETIQETFSSNSITTKFLGNTPKPKPKPITPTPQPKPTPTPKPKPAPTPKPITPTPTPTQSNSFNLDNPNDITSNGQAGFFNPSTYYLPKTKTFDTSNATYYLMSSSAKNPLILWNSGTPNISLGQPTSFTQTITGKNSALVIGAKNTWANNLKAPKSNSVVSFGDIVGKCTLGIICAGTINGTYNAPSIYITGTLQSGNGSTGGAAYLTFNATDSINIANATIKQLEDGAYKSYMHFNGNNINISNSDFSSAVGKSGENAFSFNAKNTLNVNGTNSFTLKDGGQISFSANTLKFLGNNSFNYSDGGTLNFTSNTDNLNMLGDNSFNFTNGGTINFKSAKSLNLSPKTSFNFQNASGTLNLQSSTPSNIQIQSINANSGINIISQNNNLSINQGTISAQNNSIEITAKNFVDEGSINANAQITFNANATINNLSLGANAILQANNLNILQSMALQNNQDIQGNFTLSNGANLSLSNNATLSTQGQANIYASNKAFLSFNTSTNNTTYTLLNAKKGINYFLNGADVFTNLNDYLKLYTLIDFNNHHLTWANGKLTYDNKSVQVLDNGLIVRFDNAQNEPMELSLGYNQIRVAIGNASLTSNAPNISQYIKNILGQNALNEVKAYGGSQGLKWLNQLIIEAHSPLFAPSYLEHSSAQDLKTILKDLNSTLEQVSSISLRTQASQDLQTNTYINQMNRLVKLSDFNAREPFIFDESIERYKNIRLASASNKDVLSLINYKPSKKNYYNLWLSALGGVSLISQGSGTLYGVNIGADSLIKDIIIGGYIAYAYSNFNGGLIQNGANNVSVGLYARKFFKRQELSFRINETYGGNHSKLSSNNPILSALNQQYNYNSYTTQIASNYGYDFLFKHRSIVVKPQLGLTYYYIGVGQLLGNKINPLYEQFKIQANPANKQVLNLELALETRHYYGKHSYYFVIAGISRDLFLHSLGDKVVRFVGENSLSYRNGQIYGTFANLTTGGEMRLWRSLYINLGVGMRFNLNYTNISTMGNLGMRYVF